MCFIAKDTPWDSRVYHASDEQDWGSEVYHLRDEQHSPTGSNPWRGNFLGLNTECAAPLHFLPLRSQNKHDDTQQ